MTEVNEKNYVKSVCDISLQIDSFMYISLLIEIEDKYDIELDEATLADNVFTDIHIFSMEIMDIIKLKYEKKGGKRDEETEKTRTR